MAEAPLSTQALWFQLLCCPLHQRFLYPLIFWVPPILFVLRFCFQLWSSQIGEILVLTDFLLFSVLSLWFVWCVLLSLYFSLLFPSPHLSCFSSSLSCLFYLMFPFQAGSPVHLHPSGPGLQMPVPTGKHLLVAIPDLLWSANRTEWLPLLLPPRSMKYSSSSLWQAATGHVPLSWFSPPLVFLWAWQRWTAVPVCNLGWIFQGTRQASTQCSWVCKSVVKLCKN